MKFKAAFHYILHDCGKALMIYYAIILAINLLFFMLLRLNEGSSIEFNGFEVASMIFIFVTGLNIFKEAFHFLIQHGRSRLTLALASLATIGILSVIMALIDYLVIRPLHAMTPLLFHSETIPLINSLNARTMDLANMFLTYILLGTLGLFLGALYYRMNLAQKLVVSIGVPVFFLAALPIIDANWTGGAIMSALLRFILLAFTGITEITFISDMASLLLIRFGIVAVAALAFYLSTIKVRVKAQ